MGRAKITLIAPMPKHIASTKKVSEKVSTSASRMTSACRFARLALVAALTLTIARRPPPIPNARTAA